MDERRITPFYKHDHEQLDGHFKKFQDLKAQDPVQAKECFKKFMSGLQRHIVWEEDILFPLFEEKTGMRNSGPTEVMRHEHRQIKQLLEEIHQKIQSGDATDTEEQLLWSVLKQHNMKEENILYPAIDRATSETERRDVFGQMKNLPENKYKT